jgi:hypothetical protein
LLQGLAFWEALVGVSFEVSSLEVFLLQERKVSAKTKQEEIT